MKRRVFVQGTMSPRLIIVGGICIVGLNAFETGSEARSGIGCWISYYNADRPHSAFAGRTPKEVYATQANEEKLAA
jgi:hypothetical protein